MIDRLFSLVLLFCVLAGGTTAIGVELFKSRPAPVVAELPRVVVTGRVTSAQAAPATQLATAAAAEGSRAQ